MDCWVKNQTEWSLDKYRLRKSRSDIKSRLAWIACRSRRFLNPDWQRRSLKFVGVTLILAGSFLCWQATVGNFQSLIDQQEAIRLAYFEGMTQKAIAAKVGKPLGTVKARVRRAMATLRQKL